MRSGMTMLVLLLAGCGLLDSPSELQKGPPPVVEGPVALDADAQARARAAVAETVAAGTSGEAIDCARLVGAGAGAAAKHHVEVGVATGGSADAPMWARGFVLEHPEGTTGIDEVVETPEGRAARVLTPVQGCGAVWAEARATTDP